MGWKYASLVYSTTPYGVSGHKELMVKAAEFGVCFANPVHPIDVEEPKDSLREVVTQIINNRRARGVAGRGLVIYSMDRN